MPADDWNWDKQSMEWRMGRKSNRYHHNRSVKNVDCRLGTKHRLRKKTVSRLIRDNISSKTYRVSRSRFFLQHYDYCGIFFARLVIYFVFDKAARPQGINLLLA